MYRPIYQIYYFLMCFFSVDDLDKARLLQNLLMQTSDILSELKAERKRNVESELKFPKVYYSYESFFWPFKSSKICFNRKSVCALFWSCFAIIRILKKNNIIMTTTVKNVVLNDSKLFCRDSLSGNIMIAKIIAINNNAATPSTCLPNFISSFFSLS